MLSPNFMNDHRNLAELIHDMCIIHISERRLSRTIVIWW